MNDPNQRSTSLRSNASGNRSKLLARDISESLGKLPPSAPEMEESVLGALLLERNAMIEIAGLLKADHFYSEQHKEIYIAITDLFAEASPIDMRMVVNRLRMNGKLEVVGGAYYIAQLSSKVSSSANITYHARIIIEMFMKRELIQMASQIHHDAYEFDQDVFSLLERSSTCLQGILDGAIAGKGEKTIKELAIDEITEQQGRQQGKTSGVKTRFNALDDLLNGFQNTDLILIGARPAVGKALSLNEDLLTPNGWIKMRDVKTGDMLAGSDGNFYPVTGVYPQGIRECFKVSFDDRTSVVCDGEHLWATETRADRKYKGGRGATVKTTLQLTEKVMVGSRMNHSIKYHSPINLPERPTRLHPWVMGVLLGDGGLSSDCVKLHNLEPEVLAKFQSLLPPGYRLSPSKRDRCTHGIIKDYRDLPPLSSFVTDLMGTRSYEKHIPDEYLFNSIENRIHLLQGLVDTDGYVLTNSPWIEFSTSSEKLCSQVTDLVRSLGGRLSSSSRMGKYRKGGVVTETRVNYRLRIVFANGIVPFSTKKHGDKYIPKRHSQKFIKSIEPCGNHEVQCISVASPDKLFVTTGNVLTHNTAAALQIAKNIAMDGHPVGVFSLEMGGQQLVKRLAISWSELEPDDVNKGRLSAYEFQRYSDFLGKLSGLPFYIDDTASISIIELRARAIRMKTKYGIKAIFIDYLQLISTDRSTGMTRDQELGKITRTLKGLAKELNLPVVLLVQLGRSVEHRGGDKRPMMADIRETGSAEADADVIILLYRAEIYNIREDETGASTHGKAEFIVAKHRNGSTDTAVMKFVGKHTSFSDWAPDWHKPDYTSNLKSPVNKDREEDLTIPFT